MPLYSRKAIPGEILETSQGLHVKVYELVESPRTKLKYVIRGNYIDDEEHFSEDIITFDPMELYYTDKVSKLPIYKLDTPIKSENTDEKHFKLNKRNYININFNF